MIKSRKLNKFFYPKSIAVIGASDHPQKVGGILMNKLKSFKGTIVPVNPSHIAINKIKVYSSINDYPGKIDLVIIATPAPTVNKLLEECGKKKIQNIIVISAGFAERQNFELEHELVKTAKKYNLNLLGPNCFGVTNTDINLDVTFSNTDSKKGGIAFVSQSGALWSYISDLDVGFSKFVSLGNMADLAFTEFIQYLIKDKQTKKIILYIEKLKHGSDFIKVCKASKKEIIVLKSGKTKEGNKAAISHTGSLATNYEIYKGAFKQSHVIHAESMAEALNLQNVETKSQMENLFGFKGKPKAAIITNAGGAGTLITDIIESKHPGTIKEVNDILGTATAKDYGEELKKLKYKKFDFILVALTPQSMSQPEDTAQILVKSSLRKKIIPFFLGDKSIQIAKEIFDKNNMKYYTKI